MKALRLAFACLILLSAACTISSCKSKKETNSFEEGLIFPDLPEKELIAWYSRTPCFGTCPHFDLFIFNDLTCDYEGKNFVDSVGLYHSTILPSDFEKIASTAEKINFYEMEEIYDNKGVMDLPSITTMIRKDSVLKKVMNRYKGPEELKDLYIVFDEILSGMELVKH